MRFTGGDEDAGPGRLSTNIEDRRDPRAIERDNAVWVGGLRDRQKELGDEQQLRQLKDTLALADHQKMIDQNAEPLKQNTDQLKTLNDTLARMLQPPPAEATPAEQHRAELPLPPLPEVPPFRQPPGERVAAIEPPTAPGAPSWPSKAYRDVGMGTAGDPSVLRRHLGQPQFERAPRDLAGETEQQRDRFRDFDEGQVLQRNDRNELDRRIMDFLRPLQIQVEGSGTLTANVTAPAGTRVGLEGHGLFKKTQLYRQTQMAIAATGPPNPAYSPTLEDFPL